MAEDEKYQQLLERVQTGGKAIHIMGLFSDGLVHSDFNHFLNCMIVW